MGYIDIWIHGHRIQNWIFGLEVDIEFGCLNQGLFGPRTRDPGPGTQGPGTRRVIAPIEESLGMATLGDVHLGICQHVGHPWAATIPILRVLAWKNGMGTMNSCMAVIHGAHGRKGRGSPERNPFRDMAALKGILSWSHGDS